MTTADQYTEFAAGEARDVSPTYERLALAVSGDDPLLRLLESVPPAKRQPNLLFGVVRLLGGPVHDPAAFHDFTVTNWAAVEVQLRARATQTNEVGRCALLLPVLAALPQPLALLEVGASAGLGLFPDRYSYRYGGHTVGSGGPVLDCALTGTEAPSTLPHIVWRAGLDLNPLDVSSDDDVHWLSCLLWPGEGDRAERLALAVASARRSPPVIHRGDLLTDLPTLVAQAPAGATVVVYHSAVLAYVAPEDRERFASTVRGLGVTWLSNEAPGVVPGVPLDGRDDGTFVLARDGSKALARTDGHGDWVEWLPVPDGS